MSDTEKLIALIVAWVIPAVLMGFGKRTRGLEKLFWIFIGVWGSWFTFGFYILVAPFNQREEDQPH